MSEAPSTVPLSKLYCERSAKLDQRLARLADIDSDCDLTDKEENCDLLEQRFGIHPHCNHLIVFHRVSQIIGVCNVTISKSKSM